MAKIEEIAKKIRNLGIIIGIPVLITISIFFIMKIQNYTKSK